MIRIEGSANTAQIEELLSKIISSKDDEDLLIPRKQNEWMLGGELSLIELIITWARTRSNPTLCTHIKIDEDPTKQLERLAKKMSGFVAMMMAAEIKDRKKSDRSLRASAYEKCRQIAEIMHEPLNNLQGGKTKWALGGKVFLIAVDHSTKAYIPWLYAPDRSVANRETFVTLTKEIFKKLSKFKSISNAPISPIGAILHELFKNTHEWARTDWDNAPWRRSVRGLAVVIHSWEDEGLKKIATDNPPLGDYFKATRDRSMRERLGFIELMVFDSGIGLARRWLQQESLEDVSLTEEYEACMKCLTKHQTSSSRHDKGIGLAEVMQTMSSVDGFIKIRTGRLSIYRDFTSNPIDTFHEDVGLNDFSNQSIELSSHAPVYGTHFQLLIPLYS